jgi:acetoin:2,6-dichlorophenolindophenol oxidoreductase subunit alpha
MKSFDLLETYRQMYRSRIFEEHVVQIWNDGLITGEMHTGIGEEAVNAGIVTQLIEGDALALDHRGTSPTIIRGVDPKKLLLEFMGQKQGLCSGMGGHMHIFSKSHLLASSGIVGSSGPAAAGFALAAKYLRPEKIAVAFFGEGAVNQGMMMESFNLASVLKLPVLFVCKDNDMAITTVSSSVTAGKLTSRVASFDMPAKEIDGTDVTMIWQTANEAISRARSGEGPSFLLIKCKRLHGHFLGDPLLRIVHKPFKELGKITPGLLKSTTRIKGVSLSERVESIKEVLSLLTRSIKSGYSEKDDPLSLLRKKLGDESREIEAIEQEVNHEMDNVLEEVLKIYLESN